MHLSGGGWHGKQVEVGEELEGPDSFILQVQRELSLTGLQTKTFIQRIILQVSVYL